MSTAARGRVEPHGHACLVYSSDRERADAVAAYLRAGLEAGERCMYIVDDQQPGEVLRLLRTRGVDTDAAALRGALLVRGKRETYLRTGGRFEAEAMLDLAARVADDAREAGFERLRATAEMSWALGGATGPDALLDYEHELNAHVEVLDLQALCQYDRRVFPPSLLAAALKAHPTVHVDGATRSNPFYDASDDMAADEMLRRIAAEG